jgi:hypothetical protein
MNAMTNAGLNADIKRDVARTKTDMDKAWEIVNKRRAFIGAGGTMWGNIAEAVEEGIALGRKEGVAEGIAKATEAMARLKGENPTKND